MVEYSLMRSFGICFVVLSLWISSCTVPAPSNPEKTPVIPPPLLDTPFVPRPSRTKFTSCEPAVASSSHGTVPAFPSPFPTSSPSALNLTLRWLADQRGMYIGAAGDASHYSDPEYVRLLTQEFNMVAVENAMKWQVLHPEPDRYDFSAGDALVAFSQIYRMAVYGHVLVWDYGYPAWVTEGDRTRDEWIQLLCTHVKTVASHFRGQIYAWDVVNEAFENDGTLRKTIWMQAIGPEYIAMAFQWAREADPDALLILNDHYGEGLNAKSEAIYSLVQGLLKMGAPIDGVGMQMHLWLWGPPTSDELEANMQRLAGLDLDVHITEMDVRTQLSSDSEEMKMEAQADVYRQTLAACLATQRCKVFVTWGLTDRYSWIPNSTGQPDAPLLFDENGQPKPAYFAIRDLLKNYPP